MIREPRLMPLRRYVVRVQNGGACAETPTQGCQNIPKILDRAVWRVTAWWNNLVPLKQGFQIARKQTRLPIAEKNLRKTPFFCVTWQNAPRFLEYFHSFVLGLIFTPGVRFSKLPKIFRARKPFFKLSFLSCAVGVNRPQACPTCFVDYEIYFWTPKKQKLYIFFS